MSEHSRRKKAREILTRGGYKVGGHLSAKSDEAQDKREIESAVRRGISEHEAHDHKGEKRTRIHLRNGGMAHGGAPMGRPDKKGRKGKTEVNVMVAPQGGGPRPIPVPVPHPVPVAAPGGMPPQGAGLSPAGPPGLRPGMGPMKKGGRARRADGGDVESFGETKGKMMVPNGYRGRTEPMKRDIHGREMEYDHEPNPSRVPDKPMPELLGDMTPDERENYLDMRAKKFDDGELDDAFSTYHATNPPGRLGGHYKGGGRAKRKVGKFEGGAGNGLGRLEKAEHEAKRH